MYKSIIRHTLRFRQSIKIMLVTVGLLGFQCGAPPGVAAADPEQLLKEIDRHLFPESGEVYFRLINRRPAGEDEILVFYSARQDDRMVLVTAAPDLIKGRSLLQIGKQIWLHQPGELAARSLVMGQSLFGGVLNNWDLLEPAFHLTYQATMGPEDEKALTLILTTKDKDYPYPKVEMQVNRRLMIPTEIRYYSERGGLIKTKLGSEVKRFGRCEISGEWCAPRPSVWDVRNKSNPKYLSQVIYGAIMTREFSDKVFQTDSLAQVGGMLMR